MPTTLPHDPALRFRMGRVTSPARRFSPSRPLALCATVFLAISGGGLQAQSQLSDADREALLATLDRLREAQNERIDARFRTAITAYRAAMASDTAAFDLYIKCIEKVDFEDQGRRAADFRDWRRNESDRLGDASFRRALRHQLRWLVLTLQAASANADRDQLAREAQTAVDAVFSEAESLSAHHQMLRQDVTGSVFARAYEIEGVEVERWPRNPLQLGQIYDQVLLPPLRQASRLEALRSAWTRRMTQEAALREHLTREGGGGGGGGGRIGMRENMRGPGYERFMVEQLPELQWQMEVDLFRHGDQQGAAVRMLAHLERHITHQRSREWGDQLRQLLNAPAPNQTLGETPAEATGEGGQPPA